MNKKYLLIIVILATVMTIISCNDDNGKIDEILDPSTAQKTETTMLPTDTIKAEASNPVETASTSKGALNPAHGEPGHRCEIPVGAPLNTAPALTSNKTSNNGKTTKVALNPAHGQPGHRCDIAVGAPLNSAPAVSTANATPVANQSSATNEFKKPVYTVDPVKGPLNPAHGQPGHRCDIAVGAPLNSAPAPSSTNTSTLINQTSPDSVAPVNNNSGPAETKDSLRKQ